MSKETDRDIEEKRKLVEIVQEAIQCDNTLREKYEIGDKFRFVRDRLANLASDLEKSLQTTTLIKAQGSKSIASDEVPVYVYLYNAQGLHMRTWQNLVTPKVFYEYSVNRPIYENKNQIEALLRTKSNKAQHAYLTIAIKPEYIVRVDEHGPKDAAGNPVIKVKEGSLSYERLMSLTHLDHEYILNENNELVKK